ncbi:hypothetical protein GCM10009736_05850 [Actinomadura bangladeshensis]
MTWQATISSDFAWAAHTARISGVTMAGGQAECTGDLLGRTSGRAESPDTGQSSVVVDGCLQKGSGAVVWSEFSQVTGAPPAAGRVAHRPVDAAAQGLPAAARAGAGGRAARGLHIRFI